MWNSNLTVPIYFLEVTSNVGCGNYRFKAKTMIPDIKTNPVCENPKEAGLMGVVVCEQTVWGRVYRVKRRRAGPN